MRDKAILGSIADDRRFDLISQAIIGYTNNIRKDTDWTQKNTPKILDLGCGNAWFIERAKHYLNIKIIGIDPYSKARNVIKASAYNLPFHNSYFDIIIAIEVIEHLNPKVYDEIKRVLKPKGILIVTTPKPRWDWIIKLLSRMKLAEPFITPHINVVSPEDLPFRLIRKQSFCLFEWFGVFGKNKEVERKL